MKPIHGIIKKNHKIFIILMPDANAQNLYY